MRRLFLLFGFLTLATPAALFAGGARHLFLDPAFVTQAEGVELRVNPPRREETVLRPDRPWERLMITLYSTVRDEGGRLRMWYICRDAQNRKNVAYAESEDGVHWTKPDLGIVEHEGTRANNLVGLTTLEGAPFVDPRATGEDERFIYLSHVWGEGMVRFHSPDGLHWKRDPAPLLRLGADSQAITFWDARTDSYALYLRAWERRGDRRLYRTVVRADVPDLTTPMKTGPSEKSLYLWGREKAPVIGDEFPTVLETDGQDPPNSDVYTNSIEPYPLDPRWYVGFPSFFQREGRTSEGRLEVQFIGSRDGFQWHRYDRAPYVSLGPPGSETANMAYLGPGLIVRDDELWQYGTAYRTKHGDVEARKRRTDGVICRYIQRVDGFVSADFDWRGGSLTTAEVAVDGADLLLNLDTGALGHIRVGLRDDRGLPLPGFETDACKVLQINSTGARVSWEEYGNVKDLEGRRVRVVLEGARAKVYGFRFETRP